MKIEGQKYLDKNNYSRIVIDLLGSEYITKVKCKKDYATIKEDHSFTDEIKNLNNDEKVIEIVDYFLRNNKIIQLNECGLTGYQGKFSIAYSSGDRLLALKLPDNELGYLIGCKLLDKYYNDRCEYCLNNDITKIYTSNFIKACYYGENELCLLSKYNVLNEDDEIFLRKVILNKLDYEHEAKIEYLNAGLKMPYGVEYKVPHLICGDLKITLCDGSIIRSISRIIESYNQELKKANEKQLVLKGWKNYGKYHNG